MSKVRCIKLCTNCIDSTVGLPLNAGFPLNPRTRDSTHSRWVIGSEIRKRYLVRHSFLERARLTNYRPRVDTAVFNLRLDQIQTRLPGARATHYPTLALPLTYPTAQLNIGIGLTIQPAAFGFVVDRGNVPC